MLECTLCSGSLPVMFEYSDVEGRSRIDVVLIYTFVRTENTDGSVHPRRQPSLALLKQ